MVTCGTTGVSELPPQGTPGLPSVTVQVTFNRTTPVGDPGCLYEDPPRRPMTLGTVVHPPLREPYRLILVIMHGSRPGRPTPTDSDS